MTRRKVMAREPVYTRFWADRGGIHVKHVYEDSPEYWLPYIIIALFFVVAFVTSGYFFLRQPFADRLEYLVGPLTLVIAMLTGIDGKSVIFTPAFVIGSIWGVLSIFTSVNFNLAAYVFCYCSTLVFMAIIQLLTNR